jgi:hypothetical protein
VTLAAEQHLLPSSTQLSHPRPIHVGIHVRSLRHIKASEKRATVSTLDDDVDLLSAQPTATSIAWNMSDFEIFADAARALQTWWQAHHGSSERRFRWLVFSDSEVLRAQLQRTWAPLASTIDLGSPSHTERSVGRDCNATYMEWLLLSKCELLVVSSSGFSMSAATHSEQLEQVAAVARSVRTGRQSITLYQPNRIAKSVHPASFDS